MEKSEFSEDSLRKFFGDRIGELADEQKINLYKILVEYFLVSKSQIEPHYRTMFGDKGAGESRFLLDYLSNDKEESPLFEERLTRKYAWPEQISGQLSGAMEANKLEEINSNIELLKATVEKSHYKHNESILEISEKVDQVLSKTASLSAEKHERYIPQSFGIDINEYPVSKFIPVKVYLSEHPQENISEVIDSIGMFIDSIGFLFSDEFPSKRGSWWKSWFGKSKEVMTSEEFTDRLKKGERAIELATLDKVQSEVNKNNSEAASNLIGALADVENAAIQIGSLLLVKVTNSNTSSIHTRQLTNKEMILLEKNQSLLHQPTTIIEQLERLSCENAA